VAFRIDAASVIMPYQLNDRRLLALQRELRVGRGECPFIVLDKGNFEVHLAHYDGGRDATYVAVTVANGKATINAAEKSVTVGYPPFVAGTTIIYDLNDETMQGKARPFACDFGRTPCRVYVVMPFQIEQINIAVDELPRRLKVEFLDAQGERIQAALPFRLQVVAADHPVMDEYGCTDRAGIYAREFPAIVGRANTKITVRSLLTGRDESAAFSPH
jgi:hypothetical protein